MSICDRPDHLKQEGIIKQLRKELSESQEAAYAQGVENTQARAVYRIEELEAKLAQAERDHIGERTELVRERDQALRERDEAEDKLNQGHGVACVNREEKLLARVKQLEESMVGHFQRDHLEGDGPEIDRWKRKLSTSEASAAAKDGALKAAKEGIQEAIYSEDGLDGAEGERILAVINKALEAK